MVTKVGNEWTILMDEPDRNLDIENMTKGYVKNIQKLVSEMV